MLWELKGHTPFQENNSMEALSDWQAGKKKVQWTSSSGLEKQHLLLPSTFTRHHRDKMLERRLTECPWASGGITEHRHTEPRAEMLFSWKFQVTWQRAAAALNGILCPLKGELGEEAWRAKLDFHQHKKKPDAIGFVIKVSETCRFSCLTLC